MTKPFYASSMRDDDFSRLEADLVAAWRDHAPTCVDDAVVLLALTAEEISDDVGSELFNAPTQDGIAAQWLQDHPDLAAPALAAIVADSRYSTTAFFMACDLLMDMPKGFVTGDTLDMILTRAEKLRVDDFADTEKPQAAYAKFMAFTGDFVREIADKQSLFTDARVARMLHLSAKALEADPTDINAAYNFNAVASNVSGFLQVMPFADRLRDVFARNCADYPVNSPDAAWLQAQSGIAVDTAQGRNAAYAAVMRKQFPHLCAFIG